MLHPYRALIERKSFNLMTTLPQRFATVRLAVAFLGQPESSGWWTSSFLSPNGLAVQYNVLRGPGYAAAKCDSRSREAACTIKG